MPLAPVPTVSDIPADGAAPHAHAEQKSGLLQIRSEGVHPLSEACMVVLNGLERLPGCIVVLL